MSESPGLIDYFDLFRALQKQTVQWIDDAQEIEQLQARLVTPLPKRYWAPEEDDSDIEETNRPRPWRLTRSVLPWCCC